MTTKEIKKQRILDVALEEFAEKGLYGARINYIAEKSGVNKRNIYEYFDSKDGLYSAVLTIVYERLAKWEQAVISQDASYEQSIKNIIKMYFDFFYDNPSFVKIVMWENLNNAKYIGESKAISLKENALSFVKKVLIRGKADGVFKESVDVDEVVMSINMFTFSYFSNIHTMAHILHRDFGKREAMEKRCAHITEMILDHILKEGR
jgi:TetR/AcrR family transcriptional regulator